MMMKANRSDNFKSARTSTFSFVVSVFLHLAIVGSLLISLPLTSNQKSIVIATKVSEKPKKIVQAVAISAEVVEKEVKRIKTAEARKKAAELARIKRIKAEKARKIRQARLKKQREEKARLARLQKIKAEKARQAALAKKAAERKKRLAEEKRQAELKRIALAKKQAEEKRKAKAEEELKALGMSSILSSVKKAKAAQKVREVEARRLATIKEKYLELIRQTVQANWITNDNIPVTLSIQLDSKGFVRSVSVVKSSGNQARDRQALLAVKKSAPFALPKELGLRQEFSKITMTFGPKI